MFILILFSISVAEQWDIGNGAMEEHAERPRSGSPGTAVVDTIQRGITSQAEDGKEPKSDTL